MLIDLSLEFYNEGIYFFDSWEIARDIWNKNLHVVNPNGNVIHINSRSMKIFHDCTAGNLTDLLNNKHDHV